VRASDLKYKILKQKYGNLKKEKMNLHSNSRNSLSSLNSSYDIDDVYLSRLHRGGNKNYSPYTIHEKNGDSPDISRRNSYSSTVSTSTYASASTYVSTSDTPDTSQSSYNFNSDNSSFHRHSISPITYPSTIFPIIYTPTGLTHTPPYPSTVLTRTPPLRTSHNNNNDRDIFNDIYSNENINSSKSSFVKPSSPSLNQSPSPLTFLTHTPTESPRSKTHTPTGSPRSKIHTPTGSPRSKTHTPTGSPRSKTHTPTGSPRSRTDKEDFKHNNDGANNDYNNDNDKENAAGNMNLINESALMTFKFSKKTIDCIYNYSDNDNSKCNDDIDNNYNDNEKETNNDYNDNNDDHYIDTDINGNDIDSVSTYLSTIAHALFFLWLFFFTYALLAGLRVTCRG
jgi:hypothetical protein